MIKKLFVSLCLIALPTFFQLKAGAASYTDPMSSASSDSVRSPAGLIATSKSGLPDTDYLTFQSPSSQTGGVFGSVTYQVSSPGEIIVDIYTHGGSFFMYNDVDYEEVSGYMLGFVNPERVTWWDKTRPVIGLAADGRHYLYADIGGTLNKMSYYRLEYTNSHPKLFSPVTAGEKSPTGQKPYALAVYSRNGSGTTLVPMERIKAQMFPAAYYCHEQFRGTFTQSGITEVIVEINDISTAPYSDGSGFVNILSAQLSGLASVTLSGEQMILGPVETVRPPEEDPVTNPDVIIDEESSSSRSRSRAATASSATSYPSEQPENQPSSPDSKESAVKSSPSKFEGSIEIPPPSSKSGASSAPRLYESARQYSVETSLEASETPEPLVYQPGSVKKQSDPFGIAVVVYIAATAAAILFVVIRSFRK